MTDSGLPALRDRGLRSAQARWSLREGEEVGGTGDRDGDVRGERGRLVEDDRSGRLELCAPGEGSACSGLARRSAGAGTVVRLRRRMVGRGSVMRGVRIRERGGGMACAAIVVRAGMQAEPLARRAEHEGESPEEGESAASGIRNHACKVKTGPSAYKRVLHRCMKIPDIPADSPQGS